MPGYGPANPRASREVHAGRAAPASQGVPASRAAPAHREAPAGGACRGPRPPRGARSADYLIKYTMLICDRQEYVFIALFFQKNL